MSLKSKSRGLDTKRPNSKNNTNNNNNNSNTTKPSSKNNNTNNSRKSVRISITDDDQLRTNSRGKFPSTLANPSPPQSLRSSPNPRIIPSMDTYRSSVQSENRTLDQGGGDFKNNDISSGSGGNSGVSGGGFGIENSMYMGGEDNSSREQSKLFEPMENDYGSDTFSSVGNRWASQVDGSDHEFKLFYQHFQSQPIRGLDWQGDRIELVKRSVKEIRAIQHDIFLTMFKGFPDPTENDPQVKAQSITQKLQPLDQQTESQELTALTEKIKGLTQSMDKINKVALTQRPQRSSQYTYSHPFNENQQTGS